MPRTIELIERVHANTPPATPSTCRASARACPRRRCTSSRARCLRANVFGYKAYTSSKEGVRFLVYAFDAERGSLDAVIEANRLGHDAHRRRGRRRGQVALARRLEGRRHLRLGLAGRGTARGARRRAQARAREGLLAHAEKVAKFCEKMSKKLSLEVVPAKSSEDAVRGSDIVVTITTSATPVFDGEWLAPGTHVNAAGSNSLLRREIDETTVRKADPVVVDSRPSAHEGGGRPASLAGERPPAQWACSSELGEVIAGTRPGPHPRRAGDALRVPGNGHAGPHHRRGPGQARPGARAWARSSTWRIVKAVTKP